MNAVLDAARETTRRQLFPSPDLSINGTALPRIPFILCEDLSAFELDPGVALAGVIGMDLLRLFVMEVDLEQNTITFLTGVAKDCNLPIAMNVNQRVSVIANVQGLGERRFLVDTGAVRTSSVELDEDSFKKLTPVGNITSIRSERATTLHGDRVRKAGELRRIGIGPLARYRCTVACWNECVLGWEFFSGYKKITFDFPGGAMFMIEDPARMSRKPKQRGGALTTFFNDALYCGAIPMLLAATATAGTGFLAVFIFCGAGAHRRRHHRELQRAVRASVVSR